MAKYEIIKAEIKKDARNHKYTVFTLRNVYCVFEVDRQLVIHNDTVTHLFESVNCNIDAVPENCKYIYGHEVEWKAPYKFCRKHQADHPEYGAKAGTLITDSSGNFRIFDSLRVFCLYYIDEDTNKLIYLRGWDPDTIGIKMLLKQGVRIYEESGAYTLPSQTGANPAPLTANEEHHKQD